MNPVSDITPNADLLARARELGVELTARGAWKLRARVGEQAARDRVEAIGALLALADRWEVDLSSDVARRRLDAAGGDYDVAAGKLVAEVKARKQRVFSAEAVRLEAELYARDARARHAAFLAGALGRAAFVSSPGTEAELLLVAAADAGLTDPGPADYVRELAGVVTAELERLHPPRRSGEWQVLDADGPGHGARVAEAERAEQRARDMLFARRPSLGQRIDRLAASPGMRTRVGEVLQRIRVRLAEREEAGSWRPDPERYWREVVEAAADEVRAA